MNLEQATRAGGWAREGGRALATCPTYAIGRQGEPFREAWIAGWQAKDRELGTNRNINDKRQGAGHGKRK